MTEKNSESKDDDELNIDLSGMKKHLIKFFKSFSDAGKIEKQEDDLSFDWRRITNTYQKYPTLFLLLFILILQFIPNAEFLPWGGIWMRMQTQDLHIFDDWAANSVYNYYRNQLSGAINQQYPNLPDANKAKIIDEQLKQLLTGQDAEVQKQIEGTASFLKENYQYEQNGRTYVYMPDIDPYFYLRRTENYLKTGMLGDTIKDGKEWDTHQLAPIGVPINKELHYYVLAYIHKIFSLFNPNITPMQSVTYFPIIFVTLAIIFAFLIGNIIAGPISGIFAATLLSISTAGLGRTQWGHADTDAYVLFFPVLIIWCLINALETSTLRKRITYLFATSASIGLYSFAWTGWWYMFDFILAAFGMYTMYLTYMNYKIEKNILLAILNKEVKTITLFAIAFIILSGVFVTIFRFSETLTDPFLFFRTFTSPFNFRVIKAAAHASLWPNVYTTVAELNPINLEGIINTMGGKLLFALAILGIILLVQNHKKKPLQVYYALLLMIWLIGTIYASTKGVRFTLLIVPAFSLAFSICAGLLTTFLRRIVIKHIQIPTIITTPLTIIIFILAILYSQQVQAAYQSAKGDVPLVNDAWWNALTAIKQQSSPNSIINSWWDFGHHFKYIADRGVTFDGGTQNSPAAHWIGKVLLTENEDEAVGILRMLDCANIYEPWDALFPQTNNDTVRTVKILYKILPINDREQAKKILVQEGIQKPDAVLAKTHCNPPENYFIASEDMVGKSGVWAHFGAWNFERAYIWLVLKNQPQEQAVQYMINNFNYTKDNAEQTYYDVRSIPDEGTANGWISPWPGYQSGFTNCNQKDASRIECDNGVQINRDTNEVRIVTPQGVGIPKYFVSINEKTNELQKKEYNNSNINLAIILVPRGNSYSVVISTPELATSMFTRMFFMEGHGLKYFTPFNTQQQIGGGSIFVYKTDWKEHKPNVISALVPKTTVSNGNHVTINYIGYDKNNKVFDSSIINWSTQKVSLTSNFDKYKTQPLEYTAGSGQTVKGFDNAIIGMNLTQTKVFNITPEEGYGTDPTKHPLANKTLYFKVRVEKIR